MKRLKVIPRNSFLTHEFCLWVSSIFQLTHHFLTKQDISSIVQALSFGTWVNLSSRCYFKLFVFRNLDFTAICTAKVRNTQSLTSLANVRNLTFICLPWFSKQYESKDFKNEPQIWVWVSSWTDLPPWASGFPKHPLLSCTVPKDPSLSR